MNAPHHLQAGSMEKQLDINFRLLREELLAPLRRAVMQIRLDLQNIGNQHHGTDLRRIQKARGGLLKDDRGSPMLNV